MSNHDRKNNAYTKKIDKKYRGLVVENDSVSHPLKTLGKPLS
jgi:hypothetical protein